MGLLSDTPPGAPNYNQLAEATAASNQESSDRTLAQNRPNQTDQYGNTLTWSQGPDGQWTQNISMGQQGQAAWNQQQGLQSGLMGQAANSMGQPFNPQGLQGYSNYDPTKLQGVNPGAMQGGAMGQMQGGYDPMGQMSGNYGPMGMLGGAGQFGMDPMGNSKAIQEATYGLLSPQRDMARNSEIQRLKNQGLTEDSPAFQRAMLRQGQADTDAQLKSLLAGQAEYGNQFNRGLQGNQSNFNQNLQQAQFGNQSQQQRYAQDLGQAQFNSQNQNQQFNQDLSQAQFGSANQQQGFNQMDAQQRLALALRQQQHGEQGDQAALNMKQREQQFGEAQSIRDQPLKDLTALQGIKSAQSPEFGKFVTANDPGGTDYQTAGQQQNTADIARYNAEQAAKYNNMQGIMGGLGGLLGASQGTAGNDLAKWFGGLLGDAGGGIADWWKNLDLSGAGT